jgi:hypothetical protein
MSERRVFGDAVARSLGLHDAPTLTTRTLRASSIAATRKVTLAAAAQWRESTADAVFTQPDIPVPNTAGRPGAYTGSYGQIRIDCAVDRATAFAVEAVHFAIGDAVRNAGGHDSNYIGVEIKREW